MSPRRVETLVALALAALLGGAASADPLNGNIEVGTSVAGSYDSRNVLTNPAALGFETELNGSQFGLSYGFGLSRTAQNDGFLGLSYGPLGFAAEDLGAVGRGMSRYTFALGTPIPVPFVPLNRLPPVLFLGMRYVLNRPAGPLPGFDSFDLGLQLRPSKYFSLGFIANRLNEPTGTGVRQPIQMTLGALVRPWDRLEIAGDVDTLGTAFGKPFGWQVNVGFEPIDGVRLKAGYHDTFHFQAGFEVRLAGLSLAGLFQPQSVAPRSVIGVVDATTLPFRRAVQPPTAYRLQIDASIDEEGYRGGLFAKDRPSLLDVLGELEEAGRQDRVKSVIVRIDRFGMGLAAAQDIHEAILRLKARGKEVIAFLGSGGLREYLIASAATRIYMEPAGELKLIGLRAQRYFFKGTLDKIGIEGEFLAKGEYKSFPESFTRKESSPTSREATLDELKRAEDAVVDLLQKARGIDAAKWKWITGHALFGAADAKEASLIDALGSYTDAAEKLKRSYVVVDSLRLASDRLAVPPRVAVIPAQGEILDRRTRLLLLAGGGSQVTPESMERQLRAAAGDPRVRAIVLRVNSPGGEILASHQIATLIERTRKEKPVIVSMGDVAASGGYYISAPAERIFAGRLTMTGSIGVFLGKVNLGELFKKIDLRKEILSRAPFPDLDSEDRPWRPEARKIMARRLDEYYGGFVGYVAANRKLSPEKAEAAAKGRVWLGEQAKGLGLVDETAGYMDAISYAAARGGMAPDDYEVVGLVDSGGLFDVFGGDGFLRKGEAGVLGDISQTLLGEETWRQLGWMAALRMNPFLYWTPLSRIE